MEDIEFEEKADSFEHKYNFRYEEEEADILISHPRNPAQSVRKEKKKTARKRQREAKKQRQEEQRKQQLEELKRLKNLKKKELEKRAEQTFSSGGMKGDNFREKLASSLDEEFIEEEHERLMQEMYGDEYYGEEEREEDPELLKKLVEDEISHEKEVKPMNIRENIMSSGNTTEKKDIILREKDTLAAENLGKQTNFKYRSVEKNSFGLTAAEILSADRKTLNQFVSVKKLASYLDQEWRASSKQRKTFRTNLKKLHMTQAEQVQEKKQRTFERVKKAKLLKGTFSEENPKAGQHSIEDSAKRNKRKRKRKTVAHNTS
eukprot:augustus_masked-scaffold_11-processed-gene-1.7-mRNA-1 protein AED:0.00 eAED:0.00 QI:510/0/0.5/1/0/1/2/87/317